jgi:tetratricopeptide (TPR) repeat protein
MRAGIMAEDSFGSLLRFYRRRARDVTHGGSLSQDRLADLLSLESGIIYSRAAVSDWERGKGHIHKDARHLLVSLIKVLHDAGGIQTRDEANQWLAVGNYRILNGEEVALVSAEWRSGVKLESTATSIFMAPALPAHDIVGRGDLLAELRNELLEGEAGLIAIHGMGGVGKTTLASALAYELRDEFVDGVLWGDFRLSSADAVLESWGQMFGVEMSNLPDFSTRATRMRGLFAIKNLLIVLDDVVDATIAQQMLPSVHTNCAVIVTTRSAEVANKLTNRQPDQIVALTTMTRRNSLEIMAGILGKSAVFENRQDANAVAALLGDLPLALQIGAALCADTGLSLAETAQLLSELKTRLEYLQSDYRPIVRLAFEQSWQLLNDGLRQAFATLAVFEGRSFSADDFAACAALQPTQAIVLLMHLCRRSLLHRIDRSEQRYQQHTLLAAYAAEKLAADHVAWSHFAHHFYEVGKEQLATGETLKDGWEHLLAGMETAHRLGQMHLVNCYWELLEPEWKRRGHYSMLRRGAVWAITAAKCEDDSTLVESSVELSWGGACLEQADYAAAQQHLDQALAQFSAQSDDQGQADTLYQLSRLLLEQGDSNSAETAIRQAWQHYQQVEDVRGMGRALYRRANIHGYRGEYKPAILLLNDAIHWQTDVDDSRGLLRSHILATRAYSELGIVEQAEVHCSAAEKLSDQLNERAETAVFYYSYAALCQKQGQFESAHSYALKALELFRAMFDVKSEANTLNLLAVIEVYWNESLPDRREYKTGLAYCEEGIVLCEQINYSLGKSFLLLSVGLLLAQKEEFDSACKIWGQAVIIADTLEHQWLRNRLDQLLKDKQCVEL